MRLLTLYLRSRQVPTAMVIALVGVVAIVQLGNVQQSIVSALLALALGLAILGYGLGGTDTDLEQTAAIHWPPRRATHVLAMTTIITAAALATSTAPPGVLLRDAAGLAGLTALAATLFGKQLAWTLPIAWAAAAAVIPPMNTTVLKVLTWPTQPQNTPTATIVAAVLGTIGLVTYAARGSRA